MIKRKMVRSKSGLVFYVEFEEGYHDGMGRWRVVETDPQEYEVGDLIHPDEMTEANFTIIDEDEEEEVPYPTREGDSFVFVDEDGVEHNPTEMAGEDPVLQAMVQSTNDVLHGLMIEEDEDDKPSDT